MSLGQLLEDEAYSKEFSEWYLLPMGACIWSSPMDEMLNFSAFSFLKFCMNHGLLQVKNRPQWRSIRGGCYQYVDKALAQVDKKFLNSPVLSVETLKSGKVKIVSTRGEDEFDACIIAAHPPQSLQMCQNLDDITVEVLEAFKYQKNVAVLHQDISVLPPRKKAWSAWNYSLDNHQNGSSDVSVHYLLNELQDLPIDEPVIVSLNPHQKLDPNLIIKEINYEHPLFDVAASEAQRILPEVQGKGSLYFCGAWTRYGFHEDGILSAKNAVNALLKNLGQDQIKVLK